MTATLKTTVIKDPSATVDNITLDASGNVAIGGNATIGGSLSLTNDLSVADGGTGASSFNAYGLVAGGTTGTGALQSLSSTGTSGQVLTSQGAGSLPTWADVAAGAFAWCRWDSSSGTPTIGASYNISSLTDIQTGRVGVNFTTAATDANYAVSYSSGANNNNRIAVMAPSISAPSASSFITTVRQDGGGEIDNPYNSVIVMR